MSNGWAHQQCPNGNSTGNNMYSWPSSGNPDIDANDYQQPAGPAMEVLYQREPYQVQHSQFRDYPGQTCPANPNLASYPSHGSYPGMPYQASMSQGGYVPSYQGQNPFHENVGGDNLDDIQLVFQQPLKGKGKSKARVVMNDEQPRSKRAERRSKIVEEHGSVSATDRPKGQIRERAGVKEWYDPGQEKWLSAAPLDDYRHHIMCQDTSRDAYNHTPDHGQHVDDVTTFPVQDTLGQRYWNFRDKSSWGNIVDTEGREVMYMIDRPDHHLQTPNPGYMMQNGVIMLDPDDHPIIDWPCMPRLISSQIEGGRMEALRRICPWLTLPQFRARMPRQVYCKTIGFKPLFGFSGLTQRLKRFRETNDVVPWKKTHISKGVTKEERQEKGVRETGSPEVWEEEDQNGNACNRTTRSHKRKRDDGTDPNMVGQQQTKRHRSPFETADRPRSSPALPSPSEATTTVSAGYTWDHSSELSEVTSDLPPWEVGYHHNVSQAPLYTQQGDECVRPTDRDVRAVAPRFFSEQMAIKAALSYTIADYRFYNCQDPPPTTDTSSYLNQYYEIQNHHQEIWFATDVAPQLIGLSSWFGSFHSVPVPDISEEVMQRLLPACNPNLTTPFQLGTPQSYDFLLNDFDAPVGSPSSHPLSLPENNQSDPWDIQLSPRPSTSGQSEGIHAEWSDFDLSALTGFQQSVPGVQNAENHD